MNFRRTIRLTASLAVVILTVAAWANDPSPEALVEGNHWKRARAALEPRVQANPNDAQALYLLSRVKLEYRDLDGALSLAEKAAALDGKNAAYRWQVAEAVGEIADRSGNPFKRLSYGRRYRREAEATIALDSKHVDARWGLMEWHMQAGAIGGEKPIAYTLAQEIARIDPARGYLAQARLCELEKKSDPLEPFYLKAVEASPKSYRVRMKLANFYLSGAQRRNDLAEMHAREAAKLDPTRVDAHVALARALARQKRWPELDAALADAEKHVSDNLAPWYFAGDVLLSEGSDLTKAEQYFRKYLAQEPEPDAPRLDDARKKLDTILETNKRRK